MTGVINDLPVACEHAVEVHKRVIKDVPPRSSYEHAATSGPFPLAVTSSSVWICTDEEGGIGVFGVTVLVIFEIGFSVFALKMSCFSVLVTVAVFSFFLF